MFFKSIRYALLWAIFILILSSIPGSDIPKVSYWQMDKFVHAFLFLILSFLLIRGFKKQSRFFLLKHYAILFTIICCIAYGGLLEVLQDVVFEDRSADIYDFIANSIGSILGLLIYFTIPRVQTKVF